MPAMLLDQAIAARFPHLSRRQARQLIAQHRVLVNERPVSIASRDVSEPDRIAIIEHTLEIEILKLTDGLVAMNKPAGMPTQPAGDRKRTGRTHQIRIHLASIGHPVVGDRRYGGPQAARLMLHAWKLQHETFGTLEAPPPDDLIRSAAPWKAT